MSIDIAKVDHPVTEIENLLAQSPCRSDKVRGILDAAAYYTKFDLLSIEETEENIRYHLTVRHLYCTINACRGFRPYGRKL